MEKYAEIARSQEFKKFKRAKLVFIWPIVILFLLYYLTLPLLAGYARPLMSSFITGHITFGYLYGVLCYLVAWILAYLYVRKARKFDEQARAIIDPYTRKKGA
ncbi:DUF485 domain-containing protein [Kroppenstedtia eburnea]|uniref:Uncharacterized membrane protein, DUF485 family n=1 Tax=Kroppenstedtia eburnea TaxID=714067 RepID=A0A1N7KKN9_9BACL|nr:DUF485 domain-containing protein [Kroppenstedtia eburnea]EGK12218.1 hypothetical protein HMPREF9374_1629 [Desmospora sp. 8437]QKI82929.1 DUF485 domain-containing protein [Kroppenstedtia eburnea]SIS62148.1 Uncharacterized membrane protein, DUF485 family [Kroppenstedtia eburnea]